MNWSNNWDNTPDNKYQAKGFEGTWSNSPTPTPEASNPWDAKSQDEVLVEWDKRKQLLEKAKEDEMEFRKYVVKRAFPAPKEGMNTLELGNGYNLKAGIKYNYKLADNDVVEKALDELAHTGNDGSFIADRLVGWTPNFHLTEYRTLQDDAAKGSEMAKQRLRIIDKFLTIDDAAPTLEIKAPKGKKK